ncbi:MAG: hypothetical protein LIO93_10735, partial [Bacteroidales bacterium]|nr:hypothetical protein [Bacteroidales bacterium]
MQTSTNKSTKEQITEILEFILKNWYYFLIGFGICGIIGIIHLKTATPIWNVRAQVGLRHDESLVGGNISKASSLMSSFGFSSGSVNIEDETLKLSSQGNFRKLVENFGLNTEYVQLKYLGLSKTKLYENQPILLKVDPHMADTLRTKIEFSLNISPEVTKINMKAGKKEIGTFELSSFPE